jgi:tetratricopeptide (TPR) repeat protein
MLKKLILEYINDPYNEQKNYNLGLYYYSIGQTASALSFFLRTAEWGKNSNLIYESLIMVGLCLSRQNRRNNSELGVYLQAVRYNPNRPEAYYFISLLQERKGEWLECHVNSTLSFNLKDNACDTVYDFGWRPYKCIFQKAISAWWIGQIDLSAELFYELADKYGYDLDESHRNSVLNNFKFLGLYNHKHLNYTKNQYHNVKFKFNDIEKLERNFSQAMQDMFVLTMLNGKKDGSYLEIGSGHAFYGSNTAVLDKNFNWKGISIDYNLSYIESFKDRSTVHITQDALSINYDELLSEYNFPKNIDYLQLDCDPTDITFEVLKKIPFDKYKFAVITFEHDFYTDSKYRDLSREYLISKGYELIVDNIAPDRLCSFEDWWIHPDLVDKNIVNNFRIISNKAKKPTDFMFI